MFAAATTDSTGPVSRQKAKPRPSFRTMNSSTPQLSNMKMQALKNTITPAD